MNGDHFIILFQYELCHLRNLKGADPRRGVEDVVLLRTIIRANVDAFWSREPGTVDETLREIRKLEVISRKLGVNDVLPAISTFPLKYTQEMGIVVCILIRSLDKGRYQDISNTSR